MVISLVFPFSSPRIPITPLPTSCVFTYLFGSPQVSAAHMGQQSTENLPVATPSIRNDLPSPRNYLQPTIPQYGVEPQGQLSYLLYFFLKFMSPFFKKIFLQLFPLGSL